MAVLAIGAEGIQYARTRQSWLFRPRGSAGHTIYDPLLGWTSAPSTDWPDLYGQGIGASYNARGFLGAQEHTDSTPPGRSRILFLGDSFTEGVGVGSNDTYPAQMELMAPQLQAVNLAKSSYGIDQAILRYERDAAGMEADFVVLAAIDNDLARCRTDRFLGWWPKPRFKALPDGSVELESVPPPDFSAAPATLGGIVRRSALYLIPRRFFQELNYDTDDQVLANALFNRVRLLAGERGHQLALVYLPTIRELQTRQELPLADRMRRYAGEHDVLFVNMVQAFRELTPELQSACFLGEGNWHYNRRGHAIVAETLLRELPLVAGGPQSVKNR